MLVTKLNKLVTVVQKVGNGLNKLVTSDVLANVQDLQLLLRLELWGYTRHAIKAASAANQ